jgi:hypothetical protein
VFRGSVATLARDGPGSAAYFAVYEYTKRKLTPEGQSLSLPAVIMAGGFAGKIPFISSDFRCRNVDTCIPHRYNKIVITSFFYTYLITSCGKTSTC